MFDHEVKAKRYVSPPEQELLDKQAAEAERIRLLLQADDFRERALMKMMDGVLEIRWEDVIKIDVPKPACMLEKTPEDFNEDDIVAVKKYEKDVQFLMEERERYRRMLEAEYTKVMGLLQDGIDRFNRKVDELFNVIILSISMFVFSFSCEPVSTKSNLPAAEDADRVSHEPDASTIRPWLPAKLSSDTVPARGRGHQGAALQGTEIRERSARQLGDLREPAPGVDVAERGDADSREDSNEKVQERVLFD